MPGVIDLLDDDTESTPEDHGNHQANGHQVLEDVMHAKIGDKFDYVLEDRTWVVFVIKKFIHIKGNLVV